MALRPPARRRPRARRPDRRLPDEAVGVIAGFLIAGMATRLALLAFGVEHWTTTWRVVDIATLLFVWPIEQIALARSPVFGSLQVADLVAALIVASAASYLLALRTLRRRM